MSNLPPLRPASWQLAEHCARMAGILADLLERTFGNNDAAVQDGIVFLRRANVLAEKYPVPLGATTPLDRLARTHGLTKDDLDFVILAGMPDEHEGYASVFRSVHPRGESRPSVGLAAQLLAPKPRERVTLRERLETGLTTRAGVVLGGDGPFFDRSLLLLPGLWSALHGIETWPYGLRQLTGAGSAEGLEEWLDTADCRRAIRAITRREPVTILLTAEAPDMAFERALVLVRTAGASAAGFDWTGDPSHEAAIAIGAVVGERVPVVRVPVTEAPLNVPAPSFATSPVPIVLCCRPGACDPGSGRPVIAVDAAPLSLAARKRGWQKLLPPLASRGDWLAARFPMEPSAMAAIASDVRAVESLDSRAGTIDDVISSVRTRTAKALAAGVRLITPTATWEHLVLPPDRMGQLREAVNRLEAQTRVLDEWGFLAGRPGARGVRMLFAGPPGTGKSLGAEVVANGLRADLLLVDISRVVSKWIGETERNLAQVFDTAEATRAVLFFDEADALFGRRTEVSDAHDRYANLETAYLLSRLERYEGLAILATNLRSNIDPAFIRRLEFVVDFQEPDREERARLWRCHIPDRADVDSDVNLQEFAATYPMVGAVIRNAATAAAFLAAQEGTAINRAHFLHAIRREYEKAGRAFSGASRTPTGMKTRAVFE